MMRDIMMELRTNPEWRLEVSLYLFRFTAETFRN